MNVILIMAVSLNGKITHGSNADVTTWTSKEDQKHFAEIKKQFPVIIMGSKTYEENADSIKLSSDILRIVISHNPSAFSHLTVKGQLEFSRENPKQLVSRLASSGITKILLAGGAEINSLFFKENLVDEMYVTLEPVLFGTGKNLLADLDISVGMKLTSCLHLNNRGTLLLKYKILKKS